MAEAAAVALASRQRAVVHHIAQHDVVGVAKHVVAAVDDAVGPAAAAAGARALVANGPCHRDAGRVLDHLGGRADAEHGQVSVGVLRHAEAQRGLVVVLVGGLVVGVVAVGEHDQAPTAGQVHWQREAQAAVAGGANAERVDQAAAQQAVAGVDHVIAREVDPVADAGGVGAAGIAGGPVQGDGLAALQQAGGAEIAHRQVGRDHRHHQAADVVGLIALGDLLAPVGHHLQAPVARRQVGHRQAQALCQRGAGGQALEGPGAGQYLGGGQAQGVHQTDFLAEETLDRVVAAVAHLVVEPHGLAEAPGGRCGDALDLQIGLGFGQHRGGAAGHHRVVVTAAQLVDGREGVGLDNEVFGAGGIARDAEVQPRRVALAHRQRAHPGDRAQQHRLDVEAGAVAEINLIDPAVDVGGQGAAIDN